MNALSEASDVAPEERAEVLLLLARARLLSGEIERGRLDCHEVAKLARASGSAELLARAALECGSVYVMAQVDSGLVDLLQEALTVLPSDALEFRVRVMGRLAAAMQPAVVPEEAFALAEEAVELCRGLGDPTLLLSVFRSAGSALMDLAPPERRLELNREYAALAESRRDKLAIFRAHCWLAFDYFSLGRHDDARRAIRRVEEIATLIAQPHYQWRALAYRAMERGFLGHFSDAFALFNQAEALGREASDPDVVRCLAMARIALKEMMDPASDRSEEEESLKAAGGHLYEQFIYFGSLARRGQIDELKAGFRSALVEKAPVALDLESLTKLSAIALALEDRDLALFAYAQLKDQGARFVNGGMTSMSWSVPVFVPLAQLMTFLGDVDGARAAFQEAIVLLQRAGAVPYQGWTLLHFAEFEMSQERHEESQILAQKAAEIGRTQGMSSLFLAGRKLGGEGGTVPLSRNRNSEIEQPSRLRLDKEGEFWKASFEAETIQLSDTKGLRLLARLVAEPAKEFHVLDLQSPGESVDGGDAGELLDEQARRSYKVRVAELQADLAEAERFQDSGRVERLRTELDFIAGELSRAVGLGGSARRGGSATERARVNVQRRLKDATHRLSQNSTAMGRHVQRSVRTGAYCSYQP
jgi:tetratricopeptide (TPR) repeat protein